MSKGARGSVALAPVTQSDVSNHNFQMPRLRTVFGSLKPKTLLPLADLLLVNAAVLAGLWLWTVRDDFRVFDAQFVLARVHWFFAISAVWLLLAVIQDFYKQHTTRQLLPSLSTLFGVTGLLLVVYFAVYFFAPRDNTLPRGVVVSIAGVSFLFVGIWRVGYITLTARFSHERNLPAIHREIELATAEVEARRAAEETIPLDDTVLTVQEVADHLKVSQATVWRWCKSGKLPAYRVGQQWRIRAADLRVVMNADGGNSEERSTSDAVAVKRKA